MLPILLGVTHCGDGLLVDPALLLLLVDQQQVRLHVVVDPCGPEGGDEAGLRGCSTICIGRHLPVRLEAEEDHLDVVEVLAEDAGHIGHWPTCEHHLQGYIETRHGIRREGRLR